MLDGLFWELKASSVPWTFFFQCCGTVTIFLRFRFRLLKRNGSGSGSDFWKSYGSGSGSYFWKVTVPVPVPYLYHKKQIFLKNLFPFYIVSCFTRKKIININKFIVKCDRKKMLNEGNQIHNFISSSGSWTVINYGSGSDFLSSYSFRFRFHNTVFMEA